jgi:hypothetical protein
MCALVIYCAPGKTPAGVGVATVGEGAIVAGSVLLGLGGVAWGDPVFEDKSG